MASFTTSNTFTELSPNPGYKEIIIETPTMSASDEVQMTLEDHGIDVGGFLSITGYFMSSTYGIVAEDEPETSVISGVLTISSQVSGQYLIKRIYRVIGKSA